MAWWSISARHSGVKIQGSKRRGEKSCRRTQRTYCQMRVHCYMRNTTRCAPFFDRHSGSGTPSSDGQGRRAEEDRHHHVHAVLQGSCQ